MNNKRWIALGVFILFLLIYGISSKSAIDPGKAGKTPGIMNQYLTAKKTGDNWIISVYKEGTGKTLALIKVEGVIMDNNSNGLDLQNSYNHTSVLEQLSAAFSQEDIKGVILQINSPGGGVYESDEIYNRLLELKAKYKKPFVVYMGQQATSGGYYISMAADKIFANRNTLTGSIGVIISTYNYSQLANKIGIQDVTFKSGAVKDLMNPLRPATEQEKSIMQELVNESFGFFVDVVAQGRHMDRNKVLELADGRVYSATQAKNLGLVDELGNLDSAIAGAAVLANTQNPRVLVFDQPQPNFFDRIISISTPTLDLLGLKKQINQQSSPSLMYIYNL